MKLLSIKLENFRQHELTQVDFTEGLVGVIGANGAGKSTIVEALAFAMYGSKALRGKVSEAKTYGLPANTVTSIELSFDHAGQVYRIERSLSNAKLFLGGESSPIVTGNQAVAMRSEEILGLNLDEFLASYYTEQKSLEFLSGKRSPAEREKFIAKMLGYDKIEKVQQRVREDRRDLKNRIDGLVSGLGDREEITKLIKIEKQKLKDLESEEKAARKILEKSELSAEIIAKQYEEILVIAKEFQDSEQELIGLTKANSDQLKHLSDLERQSKQRNQALEKTLAKAGIKGTKGLSTLQASLLKEQERLINEVDKKKLSIEKKTDAWQKKLQKQKTELAVSKSIYKELKEKIAALKKLKSGGDCPTCGQILGEEFAQVAKQLEAKLDTAAQKVKKQEALSKDLSVAPEALKDLQLEVSSLIEQLKPVQQQVAALRDSQKDILAEELNVAEQEKIKKVKEKSDKQISKVKADLEKLDFNQSQYDATKAKHQAASSLVQSSRLQRVKIEGSVKEAQALLGRSEEELLTYDQKQADLKEFKADKLRFDDMDVVLTDFRRYLNESIRPEISRLASSYLAELSDGRYNDIQLEADFTPKLTEDGITKSVISGGEEDIINLCLRLALSSLITERSGHSLSFLILDEVFGSLDENRRFNVLTLLERLHNRFEQILVITHLDDVKDAVNHLVYINYDSGSNELVIQDDVELGEIVNI